MLTAGEREEGKVRSISGRTNTSQNPSAFAPWLREYGLQCSVRPDRKSIGDAVIPIGHTEFWPSRRTICFLRVRQGHYAETSNRAFLGGVAAMGMSCGNPDRAFSKSGTMRSKLSPGLIGDISIGPAKSPRTSAMKYRPFQRLVRAVKCLVWNCRTASRALSRRT